MENWQRDVAYGRQLRRESGLTPWVEAQRWRRRFWVALALGAVSWGLLLTGMVALSR